MREMRDVPWWCQPCGIRLVNFRRCGILYPGGGDHGFCCYQRTVLTAQADTSEMAGRSAVSAEASALTFLVDALPFSLFLGCREIHEGLAEVGLVTGDVGDR